MCFLLQVLLFAGASITAWLICGLLHASLWVGGIGAFAFLGMAWIAYLLYQAKHPDWWPPWDEGLPQGTRMLNAFVPVVCMFIIVLALAPGLQAVRQKARQKRLEKQQRQQRGTQFSCGSCRMSTALLH